LALTKTPANRPEVSVIIPARNEEASLGACLESLVSQSGVEFEIIVVNDHSTDRTREIAGSFAGVQIIEAGPLPQGWTGKNNAVTCGARQARGEWLLFTDADTVHLPGSLARSLAEAKEHQAEMLSYSPEQIAATFWEMAILPVVFAELARQYPPSKVSDPASPIAAANGQFILIRRETYDSVGGHAAVATDILEDVALAKRVKSSGRKIRFRYAADAVRTRMYRNFAQLREGWTKNLALLFPAPGRLAAKTLVLWMVLWTAFLWPQIHWWWNPMVIFFVVWYTWLFQRLRNAKFPASNTLWAVLCGMPMFAYLLLRSKRMHGKGTVAWKGRSYATSDVHSPNTFSQNSKLTMKISAIILLLSVFAANPNGSPLQAQISEEPHFTTTLIEPGRSLGPLKLGDSEEQAHELFPKKDIDQQWEDKCGTTIDWIDSTNPIGHGEVFIRVKKGRVFQIESSTTRFQTAEEITTFDSPEKIKASYKEMRAWVLLTPPSPALGSRPPVFWIDKKRGIAFEFAYDVPHHKRYVYKVIVFQPNKTFCPEQETVDSLKWQALDPYRVEPPPELSPER
jgi:glycosyltransferase involved in cell wall biosynthesis